MPESFIRKLLNQMKWDNSKNISDYEITFIHRGAPDDLKTYSAARIKDIKGSYLIFVEEEEETGEVVIPFHRIRKILNKKTNQIIWEK